jgi:hypothetical protein
VHPLAVAVSDLSGVLAAAPLALRGREKELPPKRAWGYRKVWGVGIIRECEEPIEWSVRGGGCINRGYQSSALIFPDTDVSENALEPQNIRV